MEGNRSGSADSRRKNAANASRSSNSNAAARNLDAQQASEYSRFSRNAARAQSRSRSQSGGRSQGSGQPQSRSRGGSSRSNAGKAAGRVSKSAGTNSRNRAGSASSAGRASKAAGRADSRARAGSRTRGTVAVKPVTSRGVTAATATGSGSTGSDSPYPYSKKHPGRRKKIIIAVVVVVAVFAISLGVGGFTLYQSVQRVMADAQSVLAATDSLKEDIASGGDGVVDDARQISEAADRMSEEVSGPLWDIAASLPVYGSDVTTARELVSILDGLSDNALSPLADVLAQNPISDIVSDDGSLNITGVQGLCNTLSEVAPAIHDANARVQALGDTHIDKLTSAIEKVQDTFSQLDAYTTTAEGIAPVVPQLLGAESPRSYLIVAENNSEIRALGGFSGASGILTISDGKIELEEFESTQTVDPNVDYTGIVVSDEEEELFQPDDITLDITAGDSLMVPDFPRAADLTCSIWRANHTGAQIDGVVAIDPIVLQRVLQLTGGVTASDGTAVDGTNAAKALLSDVYWRYPDDGEAQDEVFASVASEAFKKVMSSLGSLDLKELMSKIQQCASEGRILVWMADESEQAIFSGFGVGGELPSAENASEPVTGVYVNNYSYSKLDWYLNMDVQKGEAVRNDDGTVSYSMSVTLTNAMTEEEAEDLPAYVQAHSPNVDAKSQERLGLYLYAPAGGSISNVSSSAGDMDEASHMGLQVYWGMVYMLPGESVSVTYTVTVPVEGADSELRVHSTPTAQIAREGQV